MTRSNTAIRLVSTKDINRQQWLDVRKQGLVAVMRLPLWA
jgi:predicted phage-related endonuclease